MGLENTSWLLVLLDEREQTALDEMAKEMDMSEEKVVIQALRTLQLVRAGHLVTKSRSLGCRNWADYRRACYGNPCTCP